ncbi:MAG TPA: branched-chain amino acid ABC transporter permease [Pyrinomonadaceae bacterium]|jgi:branched-chain amino acid transport system permease protein|nr:branched-chain amino acid ABC transporter permease [Pyrinomonadaceae bacterium]
MDTFVQQLINGLTIGSIYALIALGYTMVYGILRLINFAHGDIYMVGAYAGLFIATAFGFAANPSVFGFAVTLIGSMAIAAALGMAIERFAYRPVRKFSKMTTLITAIGMSLFIEYLFVFFFEGKPRPFPLLLKVPDWLPQFFHPDEFGNYLLFGNAKISFIQILIFIVSILLMVALQYIIFYTKVGKAMRAVSFNLNSAKLMGINTDFVISFTFALGSALAAAGGVLTAQYNPKIDPLMGIMYGLKAFVAAVLGGIGNIPGAVLGGLVIGAAETLVVGYGGKIGIPSTYRDAVAFAILILVLLIRPAGLLGSNVQEKV